MCVFWAVYGCYMLCVVYLSYLESPTVDQNWYIYIYINTYLYTYICLYKFTNIHIYTIEIYRYIHNNALECVNCRLVCFPVFRHGARCNRRQAASGFLPALGWSGDRISLANLMPPFGLPWFIKESTQFFGRTRGIEGKDSVSTWPWTLPAETAIHLAKSDMGFFVKTGSHQYHAVMWSLSI